MKQERIQKRANRPRERQLELPPFSPREIFYPYPIRPDRRPRSS